MASDPFDGDVRRLRHSGRGGGNGDPIGYRPVRSEDGMSEPQPPAVPADAFHLTPVELRKQEFGKSWRGYEPMGVEDFRMRVADALERVIRERSVLEERLSALTEQLRAFRDRERAMNEALVVAQQLRQDVRVAGDREAQGVKREREADARRKIGRAHV